MQKADGLEWMRGQKEEQLPRPADPKGERASTTKAAQPRPTRCPGGPRSGTVGAGKRQQAERPQPATVQDSQEHRLSAGTAKPQRGKGTDVGSTCPATRAQQGHPGTQCSGMPTFWARPRHSRSPQTPAPCPPQPTGPASLPTLLCRFADGGLGACGLSKPPDPGLLTDAVLAGRGDTPPRLWSAGPEGRGCAETRQAGVRGTNSP